MKYRVSFSEPRFRPVLIVFVKIVRFFLLLSFPLLAIICGGGFDESVAFPLQ